MLLKVMFYEYMNQTFSSRKIAKKLKSDLAFMYLAGNNTPNFRIINNFRKNKGPMLEGIFIQVVMKAKELGLISFGTISIDGTKVYASASKSKNHTLEGLDKKISKLFEEAENIDKMEDKEYGEEITRKKEAGITQTRINETDTDSRLMMMKRKDWGNGYNPQNATEKQLIIITAVPNTANDTQELIPVLEKIQENYKITPKRVLADKGYGTEENYEYGEKEGIETYIPHPKQSGADLDKFT